MYFNSRDSEKYLLFLSTMVSTTYIQFLLAASSTRVNAEPHMNVSRVYDWKLSKIYVMN